MAVTRGLSLVQLAILSDAICSAASALRSDGIRRMLKVGRP